MSDELGASVGTVITVTSPQGELTPFGVVPKYKRFKVVGIFSSGFLRLRQLVGVHSAQLMRSISSI